MKRMFALLLCLMMILSMAFTVTAAEVPETSEPTVPPGDINFTQEKTVVFITNVPADEVVYTSTDLFGPFRGIMPGDKRELPLQIVNQNTYFDYLEVYIRALPHDPSGNPISPAVLAEITADARRGTQNEYSYMLDFLAQLKLLVNCQGTNIFYDTLDKTSGLTYGVKLGTIRRGESIDLSALLDVDINMGNEFMDRIGEVDWQIVVHGFGDPIDYEVQKKWIDNGQGRPKSVIVQLYCEGEPYGDPVELSKDNKWTYVWEDLDSQYEWTVMELEVPKGYRVSYKTKTTDTKITTTITNSNGLLQTGQLNWPIAVLGVLGLTLMGYGLFLVLRRRKDERA